VVLGGACLQVLPQSRKRRLLGEGPVTFYQKSKGSPCPAHCTREGGERDAVTHKLAGPLVPNRPHPGKKLWLFVLSDALVMAKPKKKPNKDTSPRGAASPSSPQVLSPRPTAQQVSCEPKSTPSPSFLGFIVVLRATI
jgi:hypothetical protein